MSSVEHAARMNFRLPRQHKALIEKAARALGQSVTEFAVGTLVQSAQAALQQQATTTLTLRDMKRFVSLLEDPPEPNEALRQAARRYREYRKAHG
jgi:uncharacterized protein (DUF1778 family)